MKKRITAKVEGFLSAAYACQLEDLKSTGTSYTIKTNTVASYLKILTYRNSIVVCTSQELQSETKKLLANKNKDEIFELPFVYGQTIHYVPEADRLPDISKPPAFSYELVAKDSLHSLKKLAGFDNSLTFDEAGFPSAETVYLAKDHDKVIGIASAALSPIEGMWEIGVDVLLDYRQANLGTYLVSCLTKELLAQEIVPFYSASVTNIASQRIAGKCGYLPLWMDTFGTILDGSSPYDQLLQPLILKH